MFVVPHRRIWMLLPGLLAFCLGWTTLTHAATPIPSKINNPRISVFHGQRFVKKQKWKLAESYFARTLFLLKKRTMPKSKEKKDFLLLGISDQLYLLGWMAQKLKKPFLACRRFEKGKKNLGKVSPTWKEWKSLNPVLPSRMDKLQEEFDRCKDVPSIVVVQPMPLNAVLQTGVPLGGLLKGIQWRRSTSPIRTTNRILGLRITRPGYELWQRIVKVPKWSRVVVIAVFKKEKKKPKKREPAPRLTPPKKPKKTLADSQAVWWIVGGVAVAAVTASVLAIALTSSNQVVGRVQFRAYDEQSSALTVRRKRSP